MCYWKNNWEPLDGHVYHFRDSNGLECDTVLHRNNGTYGLIEVKIGGDTNIEEGRSGLAVCDNRYKSHPYYREDCGGNGIWILNCPCYMY